MAWLTFRNRFGEPQETNQCTHDCVERLLAALELRKQRGFKIQEVSPTVYCVRADSDDVEIITVDDVMPDMPQTRAPTPVRTAESTRAWRQRRSVMRRRSIDGTGQRALPAAALQVGAEIRAWTIRGFEGYWQIRGFTGSAGAFGRR